MATDTGMTTVVRVWEWRPQAIPPIIRSKVDVTGPNAGTWYYYRFEYQGRYSLTGRTYTAPTGAVDSLRFGVVSCSNYVFGYFNAYGALAQRNDLYGTFFTLGDYIYVGGGDGQDDRDHDPDHEIIDLTDYRIRHSQHKLDGDLRCLHQMYPFVTVWDDHESANDSYKDGAETIRREVKALGRTAKQLRYRPTRNGCRCAIPIRATASAFGAPCTMAI